MIRSRYSARTLTLLAGSALCVAAVSLPGAAASSTTNVTTYDYTNARSGDAPNMAAISHVTSTPKWNTLLNGAVYGEPLEYNNQVIVATEGDGVYGLIPSTGKVIWHDQIGTSVSTSVIDSASGLYSGCGDINPLGITGTPVISTSRNELFVADETMVGTTQWQHIHHQLTAISLSTHKVLWQRTIDPPGANTADYIVAAEQQRPALTLANNNVYVGFGGLAGDCGQYHGFEVAVPVTGAGTELVYQVPSSREAAIWETNGAVVSPSGNLYVATGNGASTTTFDGSNAVIELSPTLKKLSIWAPTNWEALSAADWDLGSSGPIMVPGTNNIFIAGKPADGSFGYLVSASDLGTGPSAPLFEGSVCSSTGAGVFGADASAVLTVSGHSETFIFAACGSGTEGLLYSPGTPPTFTQAWTASSGDPKGPPIVAGGRLFALDWDDAQLAVIDPVTGHVAQLVSTAPLNHFATPMVANGLVLVPTHRGVEAFGAVG